MTVRIPFVAISAAVTAVFLCGCGESVYYGAMEQFGYEKRHLLVEDVEEARDAQNEAKEQFRSALEQFASVVEFDGGELEDLYERLRDELDESEDAAEDVSDRIRSVEKVSAALFAEWEAELDEYTTETLRRSSEKKLRDTRKRYDVLIAAMQRAESRIEPVLKSFRDQVLFIKHNLNAKAVASLQSELEAVETNVEALLRDMEAAIAEADEFIAGMEE